MDNRGLANVEKAIHLQGLPHATVLRVHATEAEPGTLYVKLRLSTSLTDPCVSATAVLKGTTLVELAVDIPNRAIT